jgi:primase-polymerase (primpol)-like protein
MIERICPECHSSMKFQRADAVVCSTKCRVRAHRREKVGHVVPAELLGMTRWVRRSQTKRPLTVEGWPASVMDPEHWASHEEAAASRVGVGMGFVLAGDGIGVIDLDHCLEDGKPTAAAAEFLKKYRRNWIEVSQSGHGLHIWCRMGPAKGSRIVTDEGLHVETYSQGRYIALGERTFQRGSIV